MLIYKKSGKDILEKLKKAGYSTYVLHKEKLLGQGIITKLNNDIVIGIKALEKLCELLQCQPGDIIVSIDPETGRPHGKSRKSS